MINWGKTFENSFFFKIIDALFSEPLEKLSTHKLRRFSKKNLAKGNF